MALFKKKSNEDGTRDTAQDVQRLRPAIPSTALRAAEEKETGFGSRRFLSAVAAASVAVAVTGLGVSFVAFNEANTMRAQVESQSEVVYRVIASVPEGGTMQSRDVEELRVSEGIVPDGAVRNVAELTGQQVNHTLPVGAIVTASDFVSVQDRAGDIPRTIADGMVAMKLSLGGTASAPASLSVGDHVNVVSFNKDRDEVAHDVVVLAVDADTSAKMSAEYSDVTLQLTMQQAIDISHLNDGVRIVQLPAPAAPEGEQTQPEQKSGQQTTAVEFEEEKLEPVEEFEDPVELVDEETGGVN